MQHAKALMLCCIAQRPDIEAETRVVVRGQECRRADLVLYMRLSPAYVRVVRHRRREGTCVVTQIHVLR